MARRAISDALVGMGFVETISHTLIDEKSARLFMTPDMTELRVDDDRAKAWPVLRPSLLPSLLKVRAINKDNGVNHLRLFESASTFWRTEAGHQEVIRLGLLADFDSDRGFAVRVPAVPGRMLGQNPPKAAPPLPSRAGRAPASSPR